jgi:hypothetical protein
VDAEELRRTRIAQNESLYRGVNDKIEELNQTFSALDDGGHFAVVCECGLLSCTEQIEIAGNEYEAARSDPTLFIIVPGHAIPDVETIVERRANYEIVCKDKEPGATVARVTDPRS